MKQFRKSGARVPWLCGALCLAGLLANVAWVPARSQQPLRLGEHGFDWTTIDDEDLAHFHWKAEVVNDSRRGFDVKVTVQLLDADDAVIGSDTATASVAANSTVQVEHDGSLPYDRAADVVSFRFRIDPVP